MLHPINSPEVGKIDPMIWKTTGFFKNIQKRWLGMGFLPTINSEIGFQPSTGWSPAPSAFIKFPSSPALSTSRHAADCHDWRFTTAWNVLGRYGSLRLWGRKWRVFFQIPSLKLPENGCLEDDSVLLGPGLFSGAMLQGGLKIQVIYRVNE